MNTTLKFSDIFFPGASPISAFYMETSDKRLAYTQKKYQAECIALINALIDAFSRIAPGFAAETETEPFFGNIILGILETVSIKIDRLNESKELLNSRELIHDQISDLSADDMLTLINECKDANSAFAHPVFINFRTQRQRQFNTLLETVRKVASKHLCDYVLAEVSSFDEIMRGCIPQLKNSEPERKFAVLCATVYQDILGFLKRHDINQIIVPPRDMFDPKLHEVISVSARPGFNKGEIIEQLSIGLINDISVYRAKVICSE